MRIFKSIFLITFLLSTYLSADDSSCTISDEDCLSIIDLQGHPNSIVGGMVNVITGNLVDFEQDFTGVGANPIHVQRSYNSSNKKKGTLCHAWNHHFLQRLTYSEGEKEVNAFFEDRGSQLAFKRKINSSKALKLDKDILKWGVTNGTRGVLSGRSNIQNRTITHKAGAKRADVWMETGEQVVFKREKEHSDGRIVFLAKEFLFPNGNRFDYTYHGETRVDLIKSVGSQGQILDRVKVFDYNPVTHISCGNEKSIWYRHEKLKSGTYLKEVSRPTAPDLYYDYAKIGSSSLECMVKKAWPEGRFIQMDYYADLQTKNGVTIWSKKDARFGRVCQLSAPVGEDDTPKPTFQFIYAMKDYKKKDKPVAGRTDVIDALGFKKAYNYDWEHRLMGIDEYDDEGECYRKERFIWGGSGDKTFLAARTLKDAADNIVLCRKWQYDKAGNMLEEVLYGNLSGDCQVYPEVAVNGTVTENGCEKYIKKFTYTADNYLASEDDGKVKISYAYWPGSDKVKMQYMIVDNAIIERAYYNYDANGVLIHQIIDDGRSNNIQDFTGVTQRLIQK